MPLVIENRGKGFIGEIGQNWRISQNGSPMTLGDSSGRLGSLSFSASCDETSKFTIDNYLSVKHFFDDQANRWLSSFDGHLRSVQTNGNTGQFSMTSLLSALDVERRSYVDAAGTLQRTIEIPKGVEYTIPGQGTFTIGGYWTSVGSENVFVPRPTKIWDIAAGKDYIYVLCAGQHLGEVVVEIGIDGIFRSVWPVYSDATDIASPDSRYIALEEGSVWIAQVNADRVKRFTVGGVFVNQWGSAGTGNGQFNTISGIATSESFNAIYVTDSVLGRVQCFDETGTYLFQWGTLGTGSGNTVFNAPNYVSCDPVNGNVFVSDRNARVRAYTSGGSFTKLVMGSYNFTTNTSTGEFVAGAYPIKTSFDHLGNAYAIQLGKVFKYVKGESGAGANWTNTPGVPIKQWDTPSLSDPSSSSVLSVNHESGIMFVARSDDKIDQYSASLGTLQAYILYYVALAGPDIPVRLMELGTQFATGDLNFISWEGNVWDHLCQLAAATDCAIVANDNRIVFLNRANRYYRLPEDFTPDPVALNSRATGQSIEIVNYNSRYTVIQEVLYSAEADGERIFTVDVNDLNYVTVSQDSYPEYIVQPVASATLGAGKYIVIDANGVTVDATQWNNYGGAIRAEIGSRPGDILLTFIGPGYEIPGTQAPYKIADVNGVQASLSVIGRGVLAFPELLTIGTGVTEDISNRKVAQTIDSPFAHNAQVAYTEGSWAAYNTGTPDQRVTFTMRVDKSNSWSDTISGIGGTFQFVGILIEYDDAVYVVEDLDYTASTITLSCYRYTKSGWDGTETGVGIVPLPEEIWGGKSAAEFDAYWAEYTAQDFTIAPLRNPFDV